VEIESAVGFADISPQSMTFANFRVAGSLPDYSLRDVKATLEKMGEYCWEFLANSQKKRSRPTHRTKNSVSPAIGAAMSSTKGGNLVARQTQDLSNLCENQVMINELIARDLRTSSDPFQTTGGGRILSVGDMLLGGMTCLQLPYGMDPIISNSTRPASCLSPWMAANLATGGTPYFVQEQMLVGSNTNGEPEYSTLTLPFLLRMPAISPERMRHAIFKLVAELAVSMTGPAPHTHKAELLGYSELTILRRGVVPWQIVLSLLLVWDMLFTAATCLFFTNTRFAPSLGAYQLFKFGAEWHHEMTDSMKSDFVDAKLLEEIPTSHELQGKAEKGHYGFVGVTLQRQLRRLR
jgi:hypothetical protein